jgi:hypothetical protein
MTSPAAPTHPAPPRPPSRRVLGRRDALGIGACVVAALALAVTTVPSTTLLCGPLGLTGLVLAIVALALRRGSALYPVLAAAFGTVCLVAGTAIVSASVALAGLDTISGQGADAGGSAPAPLAFGATHRYPDGVAVTVPEPEAFTPSAEAEMADQAEQITVMFTIENGSAAAIDPGANPSVSSAGRAGTRIYDPVACDRAPETIILPAASATWTQCFSVADAATVVVEVGPTFDRPPLAFTARAPS